MNTKTQDANGFISKHESEESPVLGIISAILTAGISFIVSYEFFFERQYWKNRFRLLKYLRQGKVELESIRIINSLTWGDISEYTVKINEVVYQVWIWENDNRVSFISYGGSSYIGLFIGSPVMLFINNRIIKRIRSL